MAVTYYFLIGIVWAVGMDLINTYAIGVTKSLSFGKRILGGIFVTLFWPAFIAMALYIFGSDLWTPIRRSLFGFFGK